MQPICYLSYEEAKERKKLNELVYDHSRLTMHTIYDLQPSDIPRILKMEEKDYKNTSPMLLTARTTEPFSPF